jgi:hypothetical protein
MKRNKMNIVFWAIIVFGSLGAMENIKKVNALCKKEVAEGISKDMKECKQYYFDTRSRKGW